MGNVKNAVTALVAPLPSILFYLYFLRQYQNDSSQVWVKWCYEHPLLLANLLFFLNVDLLFWFIATFIHSTHWMIDLYWTVIPVLLVHYYATHPCMPPPDYNILRSRVVIFLTWCWSLRLTHNYFRRENWQWGAREDWRFSDMRLQYASHWSWVSFFAVYLSQQVFLIGVCMPLYVVHSEKGDWNMWDWVATMVCICGIIVAYYADTQLHDFVIRRRNGSEEEEVVLKEGLWKYSRHPNYVGEQMWWWGVMIFGWNLGCHWSFFIGPIINTSCLAYVTILVENRMLNQPHRSHAYSLYQKTTSVWIPWFNSSHPKPKNA